MPTPYDTTDGGKSFSREERIIAEFYGVDLTAPAPVKCDSCGQFFDAELILRDNCPECVALLREHEEEAPTLKELGAWIDVSKLPEILAAAMDAMEKHGFVPKPDAEAANFIAAPTLAGCKSLMGARLVASTIAEIRREYGDTTTER